MFEFLAIILFVWLLVKAAGLVFKVTWGLAKVLAGLLMALAVPLLIVCVVFAGGLLILVPLALVGIAVAIVKACT